MLVLGVEKWVRVYLHMPLLTVGLVSDSNDGIKIGLVIGLPRETTISRLLVTSSCHIISGLQH